MKVLLLGKKGMLGSQFLKSLSASEDFEMYAFGKELDITDFVKLKEVFKRISPDFVINCAAYTAVDNCETHRDEAFKVNAEGPSVIAQVCKQENASLVHFSTDYVFDGKNPNGYDENADTGPINVYGESKLKGEEFIKKNMDDFYIIRTSWLFGENGKNFVDTMINLSKSRDIISVICDQIGSPTYTKDLVDAVINYFFTPFLITVKPQHERHLIDDEGSAGKQPSTLLSENFDPHVSANTLRSKFPYRLVSGCFPALPEACHAGKLPFGIYHVTNSGHTSWFGFAKEIFKYVNSPISVREVTSDEYKMPALRPKSSVLKSTKENFEMRSWQDALKAYIELNYIKG